MFNVVPVPQPELKRLAQANVSLAKTVTDLATLIDTVDDPDLRGQMRSLVGQIIDVGEAVDRTVRSAVYTAAMP